MSNRVEHTKMDIILKFITVGIMLIVLMVFASLWLAKHDIIPPIDLLQSVDAKHTCMTFLNSTSKHIDRLNQTFHTTILHPGYCMSS